MPQLMTARVILQRSRSGNEMFRLSEGGQDAGPDEIHTINDHCQSTTDLGSADALAFATVVLHGRLEQVVAGALDDWQR